MKAKLLFSAALLFGNTAFAQQQGSVVYERTAQMRQGMNLPQGVTLPPSRTDKFELQYGNNKSLWKAAEREQEDQGINNGEGMQVRLMVAGSDDILFTDFAAKKSTEMRVVMEKKFIVDDSLRQLKWKMGEETKTILGHLCRQATTTTINPRMTMSISNGQMERREVQDTSNVTAWFATDIPVSAGPGEYQGQLPGLILALDINNGRVTYRATQLSEKADLAAIKEPAGKKHYTPAEFREERDKLMKQMQENSRNGGMQIRMN